MVTTPNRTNITTTWPRPYGRVNWPSLASFTHQRLNKLFAQAQEILFNDHERIVFFSDLHRGDKSAADEFAPNEALFLHALGHYYTRDYTYIEVGDGDDLWSTTHFQDIRQAYPQIYDMFHRFHGRRKLHLLFGNHEIGGYQPEIQHEKDGLPVQEALILRHARTNQRLFVTHGHQVDLWCDWLTGFSRHFVNFLRFFSLHDDTKLALQQKRTTLENTIANWSIRQQQRLEQRLSSWAQQNQRIIIAGHTHRPEGAGTTPYFNTGSGLTRHAITGLELYHGRLQLIKWVQTETNAYRRLVLHTVPLGRWR